MKEFVYQLIINGTRTIYKSNYKQVEKYIKNHPYDDIRVVRGDWHYTKDFKGRVFVEDVEDGYETYYNSEIYVY